MRYWSYDYPNVHGDVTVVTWSERDIYEKFYPEWYSKMCNKYGQKYVVENLSFEDCITDWTCINYAWESKDVDF